MKIFKKLKISFIIIVLFIISIVVIVQGEKQIVIPISDFSIREFKESDIMESQIYENYKYIKGEIILSAKLKTKYQEVHDLVTSYGGEIVGYLKTANEYQVLFYDNKTEKELIEIINKLNSNNKVLYSNLNLVADISVIRQPSLNYTEEPWLWAINVEKPLPREYKFRNIEGVFTVPNDTRWQSIYNEYNYGVEWLNGIEDYQNGYAGGNNWGMKAIDAPMAWIYNDKMNKVKVGILESSGFIEGQDTPTYGNNMSKFHDEVIDSSGFDTGHKDLVFKKILGYDEKEGYHAKSYHATHVAGLIGATANNEIGIAGLLWDVDLYGYTLSGSYTKQYSTLFKNKYALASLFAENVNIINVGLGHNEFTNLNKNPEEIEYLMHEGESMGVFLQKYVDLKHEFVIITPAGDYFEKRISYNILKFYNTKYKGWFTNIKQQEVADRIITVGNMAFYQDERLYDSPRYDSNSYYIYPTTQLGNKVDIIAPGMNILSTTNEIIGLLDTDTQWSVSSANHRGTPIAAAHVTGVVGMVWGINPNLTGKRVKDIVVNSYEITLNIKEQLEGEKEVQIIGSTDEEMKLEYPVLNANNAVRKALETIGERPNPFILFGSVTTTAVFRTGNFEPILYEEREKYPYKKAFGLGNLEVIVYDKKTKKEVARTTTLSKEGKFENVKDEDIGTFTMLLDKGDYIFSFHKEGYEPIEKEVNITKNINYYDFDLEYPLDIEVYIDGNKVEYTLPTIYHKEEPLYFSHVKPIAEALGYEIVYDEKQQTILKNGETEIVYKPWQKNIYLSDADEEYLYVYYNYLIQPLNISLSWITSMKNTGAYYKFEFNSK